MRHRIARAVVVIGLAAALAALAGCSGSQPTGTDRTPAQTAVGRTAGAAASKGQYRLLGGLLVSLRQSGVPTNGRYQLNLRAENTTDASMTIPIVGNPPVLLDSSGARVSGATGGSGFGAGARRNATDIVGGPKVNRTRPANSDVLAPHAIAIGVVVASSSPNGKGYRVLWTLGPSRAASFKLP